VHPRAPGTRDSDFAARGVCPLPPSCKAPWLGLRARHPQLDQRTLYAPVGAEDTATAVHGFECFATPFALVEELSGIRWHLLFFGMAALVEGMGNSRLN
jgi:hypothetical protein